MTTTQRSLVDLFLEIARIEGLSGAENDVADFVTRFLERLGLTVEREEPVEGGRCGNVVCRVAGGGARVLGAHLDTARSTAALSPIVGDDRITSDGTTVLGVDNRVGVAVLLHVAERVVRESLPTPGFTLAFTVREETDLAGSTTLALDDAWREAFVFDSSLRPGAFIRAAYGARFFRAAIRGRPAHAGLAPETGIDAIGVAARAVAALRTGRVGNDTTCNVGLIRGGSSVNTVPEHVELEGEVRSSTREGVDAHLSEVHGVFEREANAAGARLEWEARWDFEPFTLPEDSPICVAASQAIARGGLTPTSVVSTGGSDASVYNARGLSAVNLGIGAQNPHANEEFVLLEDLEAAARIALGLVAREGSSG